VSEIDCKYTEEIVCPYCGYIVEESYEYFEYGNDDTEIQCDECNKTFIAYRHERVRYSSFPIEVEK
jgi:hypothetical protein